MRHPIKLPWVTGHMLRWEVFHNHFKPVVESGEFDILVEIDQNIETI